MLICSTVPVWDARRVCWSRVFSKRSNLKNQIWISIVDGAQDLRGRPVTPTIKSYSTKNWSKNVCTLAPSCPGFRLPALFLAQGSSQTRPDSFTWLNYQRAVALSGGDSRNEGITLRTPLPQVGPRDHPWAKQPSSGAVKDS